LYLPWLLGQCRKQGVVFKRATLSHIVEAKKLSHTGEDATVVINALGLGAAKLDGVKDGDMTPARGQIILVRNESSPMFTVSGTDDEATDVTYLMMRASGGGTVLGGTYQLGNWDPNPDPATALRIMKRVIEIRPEIGGGKGIAGLDIVRHAVGLRPYRKGGVRIEAERTTFDDGTVVVHNYGHSGWGYQGSYGCAERVVELVKEMLAESNK
jgi:D-amino-acid oxidase